MNKIFLLKISYMFLFHLCKTLWVCGDAVDDIYSDVQTNTSSETIEVQIHDENKLGNVIPGDDLLLTSINEQGFSETTSNEYAEYSDINNDTPMVVPMLTELHKSALSIKNVSSTDGSLNNTYFATVINGTGNDVDFNASLENTNGIEEVLKSSQLERVITEMPVIAKNLSDVKNEDIPSFSEWTQKQLKEAEKKEQANSSTQGQNMNMKQNSGGKLRWKNYASLDCGAKVILSNSEAGNPWAILSPSKDEYMLNTCTSRIWFVVELCEAIQVKKIDLANYELFSSSPKDFVVSLSDTFPSRDWQTVGQFTASYERDIQSFDLNPQIFGKYIKVEIKTHYGSEHYCPISLFRAYGTSVFEVLQKDDPAHTNQVEDEADDDVETLSQTVEGDKSKNLISSATDAVINLVKKAAQVLGNKVNSTGERQNTSSNHSSVSVYQCITPSHYVICKDCNETLFNQIYRILSCQAPHIKKLVNFPFVKNFLEKSGICQNYSLTPYVTTKNPHHAYFRSFFSEEYLGAMCNIILLTDNHMRLNVSHLYSNITELISNKKIFDIGNIENAEIKNNRKVEDPSESYKVELVGINIEPSIPDNAYAPTLEDNIQSGIESAAQIEPAKTQSSPERENSGLVSENVQSDNLEHQYNSGDIKENRSQLIEALDIGEFSTENETTTESVEIIDHLENLISDISADQQNVVSNSQSASTPQGQKESVFLRLSNRIKTLERNMSLSSQYLEELSKRYKKQVEEMQRLFEQTVKTLHEDAKFKEEKNKELEQKLSNLTKTLEILLEERSSSRSMMYLLFLCAMFVLAVYFFCQKDLDVEASTRRSSENMENYNKNPNYAIYTATHKDEKKEKQKKRKKPSIPRSNSIACSGDMLHKHFDMQSVNSKVSKNNINDWQINQGVEDLTISLEEAEHIALEDMPELNSINIRSSPSSINNRLENIHTHTQSNGFASLEGKYKNVSERTDKESWDVNNASPNSSISSEQETTHSTNKGTGRSKLKKLFRKKFLK